MVLNYIWVAFFAIAFAIALFRLIFMGDFDVFPAMMNSTFESSKTAFEISLGLTGVLSLWLGVMKIGEKGGVVNALARLLSPVFSKLFPDIPKGHPVTGSIFMNIAANMLGLDNAATPLGLRAMQQMKEVELERLSALEAKKKNSNSASSASSDAKKNTSNSASSASSDAKKDTSNSASSASSGVGPGASNVSSSLSELTTASNPMIMFLVLNTSGLTLIPVSIMVYRAQLGAANPTDIFIPILLATFFATIAGIIITCLYQRINLFDRTLMLTLGGMCAVVGGIIWGFSQMDKETMNLVSTTTANILLMTIITAFIAAGVRKKVNVYEAFIEGAKEGFQTAVRIIPYLVAILVAIAVFRASGAMDMLFDGVRYIVELAGINSDFVGALPTALMKPLSGSGARGMMVDAMTTYGADSFVGRLSCIFQGSTDTTFYILAVYFGSVGVRNTRHAVPAGLLADLAGVVAAIVICYLFF